MQRRYISLVLASILVLLVLSIRADAQTPQVPTNLTVQSNVGGRPGVFLTWQSRTLGRWLFKVYRSTDDSMHFTWIVSTIRRAFADVGTVPGHKYFYAVTAVTFHDTTLVESAYSNIVSVTIDSAGTRARSVVSGVVKDNATGGPIRGAQVLFYRVSSRYFVPTAWTDSSGHYNALLDTGTYIIRAWAIDTSASARNQYVPQWYNRASGPAQATRVTVSDSSRDSSIDFSLTRLLPPMPVTIRGTVTDSSGAPIKGAFVAILRTVHDMTRLGQGPMVNALLINRGMNLADLGFVRGVLWRGTTDSSGQYAIQVFSGQKYILLAAKSGYLPEFYNNKFSPADADVLSPTGDTSGINFSLRMRPSDQNSIAGSVMDSAGTAVPSQIVLTPANTRPGPSSARIAFTDSTGNYSITNVRAGKYFVLAIPFDGYSPAFYKAGAFGVTSWKQADSVNVSGSVTGINIGVKLITGGGVVSLQGTVKTGGQAFGGVSVFARDSSGNVVGYDITASDGTYSLNGVPPGSLMVDADKEGYTSSGPVTVNVAPSDLTKNNVDFTLTPISTTGVTEHRTVPTVFALDQNYPNPFNPSTRIAFSLPFQSNVTISVFNVLGQLVTTIAQGVVPAGTHEVVWNGMDRLGHSAASGIYFYRMTAVPVNGQQTFIDIKKMVLLK